MFQKIFNLIQQLCIFQLFVQPRFLCRYLVSLLRCWLQFTDLSFEVFVFLPKPSHYYLGISPWLFPLHFFLFLFYLTSQFFSLRTVLLLNFNIFLKLFLPILYLGHAFFLVLFKLCQSPPAFFPADFQFIDYFIIAQFHTLLRWFRFIFWHLN